MLTCDPLSPPSTRLLSDHRPLYQQHTRTVVVIRPRPLRAVTAYATALQWRSVCERSRKRCRSEEPLGECPQPVWPQSRRLCLKPRMWNDHRGYGRWRVVEEGYCTRVNGSIAGGEMVLSA
ncbi:unnamed protein product [Pleuronectes platessa]|uniref:Uncharacterized protein n=1 Tax=Pleuronectes platessa TaxID=8262 RepID=A0A9N7V3Y5_PLEPL|nr:unnamed protein product [Pleuronectes platessa]